jgi:hypothetical protein
MGKKRERGKSESRKINVEIAPGNQQAMNRYIEAYNGRPDRTTPKLGYTDVVNEALDRFLNGRTARARSARGNGAGRKGSRVEREEDLEG